VPQPGRAPLGKALPFTEVMVNGPDDVYVERKGRLEKVTDGLFEGEEAVLHVMGWGGGRRGCA